MKTEDLRELYPSPYGQPREKVPGANPWFDQGGKVFGQQLSPKTQNLLGLVAELGLAGGPAIKVSRGATSAIDNLISVNKIGNLNNLPSYEGKGLLDDFITQTQARNKKSVERIARGKRQEKNLIQSLKDIQKQEIDEARRWTPEKIDKQLREDALDEQWIDKLAKDIYRERHGYPADEVFRELNIQEWKPLTLERMLNQINRIRGKGEPKIILPQYNTPTRGVLEEIARKAGMLTEHDIDFKDIPTFMRNKMGKWDDPDF